MCANNLSPVQLIATTNETNPTFQWTPNNVSQNNDSILVNPTNTTNYSVSVTAANGCVSAAGASVVVGQLPVPNFTTVSAAGNTVIFNNTTANGVAYLWNFGDGTSSTAMNPTHIYATSGQWTVTLEVTNAQGCASTSSSIVNSSVLSVNEIAASNFVVYPNPVASSFTIESDKALNSEITIISITGKIVKKAHLTNGQATINIQELQRGSYFVQIQENNTIQTKLVIKE
jgi:PKD repeat protein